MILALVHAIRMSSLRKQNIILMHQCTRGQIARAIAGVLICA